jgi:hypothetical protein
MVKIKLLFVGAGAVAAAPDYTTTNESFSGPHLAAKVWTSADRLWLTCSTRRHSH